MNELHFAGSIVFFAASELSEELRAALVDCGAPGDASQSVEYVRSQFNVTGDPESCRKFLAGYGAWDDVELSDHESNLNRLVWLAGCDLRERGEIYFEG